MKKLITLILITASFVSAMCIQYYSNEYMGSYKAPKKSGKYKTALSVNHFSNGDPIKIGSGFSFTDWEEFEPFININCKVIDLDMCYDYNEKSMYEYTFECTVTDKIQFYYPNEISYKQLKGYRNDGTLMWTRESWGSTDISCYSKNGLTIVKRVNSPSYCK